MLTYAGFFDIITSNLHLIYAKIVLKQHDSLSEYTWSPQKAELWMVT